MKVRLVTSPHVRHAAVLQNDFAPRAGAMYSFAPMGLMMLAAVLRERAQLGAELFDLNSRINDGSIELGPDFYESAAEAIVFGDPDLVGFMTECDSYHHVLQICSRIRARSRSCRIVLGGPHATAVASETIMRWDAVDAIVAGEGELTFLDLVRRERRGTAEAIPGLVERNRPAAAANRRELVAHLDELPMPAFDLYAPQPGEEVFIEVGRGCPFSCTFCSTAPFWRRRHRVKSPGRICREVAEVYQRFGCGRVHFTHDLFTTDAAWVRAVCDALIASGASMRWTCSARTDTVDADLLALMKAAGCDAIYFGLESGSERVLRNVEKNIPVRTSYHILDLCRKVGIRANVGFIVGFPEEDVESLRETFDAYGRALLAGARPAHIFGFCPFAGSSAYPNLGEMHCRGHFLDLPIDQRTDEANRQLVISDPTLFGSYHRPRWDYLPAELRDELWGSDEFSLLVEAVTGPALRLAIRAGGMFNLFRQWVAWIGHRNRERGAARYRELYGSPVDFCDFLVHLASDRHSPEYLVHLLAVIRQTLVIASTGAGAPMSMASYRSVRLDEGVLHVSLSTSLSPGNVIATYACGYDLSGVFAETRLPDALPLNPIPQCLAWHVTYAGDVRLVQVPPLVMHAIRYASTRPATAAEIILDWHQMRTVHLTPIDFTNGLEQLVCAANEDLLQIGDRN